MSLPHLLTHYLNLSQGVWEITSSPSGKQITTTITLLPPGKFDNNKEIVTSFTQEYGISSTDIDMIVVLDAVPGTTSYLAYSAGNPGKVFIISGYQGYTSALGYEMYQEGEVIYYKSYRLHEPDFYEQIALHTNGEVRTKHYYFSGHEKEELQREEAKTG